MSGDIDRAHVRLAELVGALSLGIDLGFGQPMEHVREAGFEVTELTQDTLKHAPPFIAR